MCVEPFCHLPQAAGGRACFDKWCAGFEKLLDFDFFEATKEGNPLPQVRSGAADGEGTYQGEHSGLKHYLHSAEDGLGDPSINFTWDPAHDEDLAEVSVIA